MTNYPPMPTRRPPQTKTYPVCSFKKAMDILKSKCGDVYVKERHGKGRHKVIILPEPEQELNSIISYGRRSPMNVNEQKLCGMGHFLVDGDGNVITIVSHIIEIQTMNRNPVGASNLGPNGEYNPGLDFLEYHREEFLRNEAKFNTDAFGYQVDPFLKLCGPSEFVLEGHTHPDLGVFYSRIDKVSGAARAASSPVCIFVCDPIRKKMLGSIGKDLAEAEIIVFSRGTAPQENLSEDKRLLPPTDEIVRLASQCLRTCGYVGNIRLCTCIDGRGYLKIKLVIPKGQKGVINNGENTGETGGFFAV